MTTPFSKLPMALALGATLLLPVAAPASAQHEEARWREAPSWSAVLDGRLVDVQIQVDGGTAPLYFSPREADQRRYFEAFPGRNYSVVLRNRTGGRIAVLLAVDGLNVVNGERTHLSAHESMYVLDPWERTEIRGWRTSLDDVRRFVFVDERRSYAERTGQANSDMGWIRVLSFRERRPRWDRYGHRDDSWSRPSVPRGALPAPESESRPTDEASEPARPDASRTPSAAEPQSKAGPELNQKGSASSRGEGYAEERRESFPGTGWGRRQYDPVQTTRFTPDGPAVDRLVLRYEYESGLLALGIEPRRGWSGDRLGERDGDIGFARPPRW